ncbi:MAG: SDR family NAD(P)-dependent oxidoreductase, partial [Bdellovibrionota bacterium]
PLRLTQVLAPALIQAQGRVIAVSSVAGQVSLPFYGPYAASKHALEALWEGLYHELSWKGVSVALIEPGSYRTGFKERLRYTAASQAATLSHFQREMGAFRNMMATRANDFMADPGAVADLLYSLVTRRESPDFRTAIGKDARGVLFLKRFLPGAWFRFLVRKGFQKIVFQPSAQTRVR